MSRNQQFEIIPCPSCGGDKGHGVPYDIDRRNGGLIERWVSCITCDATGEIEIELEPLDGPDELDIACPPQGEPIATPYRYQGANR